MIRPFSLLNLIVLVSLAVPSLAENHALLIGIDDYQQRDRINSLTAAAADARGMAKCLEKVAGFKRENVVVLVSDGDSKPTAANIIFELSQLGKRVNPGDTVFVLFSGHGIEIDGESYMLPYETDIRADETLKRTALATADVTRLLAKLPSKALIVVYDMCRSEPRKSGREAVTAANTLSGRQAKTLVLQPVAGGPGPKNCVTFFACSPRQRSFEYVSKKRGYFSYFLEEGLQGAAADREGVVRVRNLKDYLTKAVSGAVKREEGEEQTPYPEILGPEADDLILSRGLAPGEGGATAVPTVVGADSAARFAATFQRGYELLTQKRYDAAKVKFEDAIEIDPKASRAYYMLAYINDYFTPNHQEAERLYRRAIDLNPKDSRALSELAGLVSVAKRSHDESEQLFRRAIEADPTNSQAYVGLAFHMHRYKKDVVEAERLYLKALHIKPRSSGIREVDVKLGLPAIAYAQFLAENRKDLDGAEKLYREAMEKDPDDATTIASYAAFMFQLRLKLDDAEKLYSKALSIAPNDTAALTGMALLKHLGRRDFDEAERLYKLAIASTTYDVTAYWGYGDLLAKVRRDYAGAEKQYRKAMDIDPNSPLPYGSLGQLWLDRGDLVQAEKAARKALELEPRYGFSHRILGEIAFRKPSGIDEAIVHFKKAVELNAQDAESIKALGNLMRSPKGNLAEAERLYKQALALNQNDAQAINGLGNIRLDQNQLAEAELLYKKAVELDPSSPVMAGNLAYLYQKRQNNTLAEQWFRKSLELDPKNHGNHNLLGNIYLSLSRAVDAERHYRSAILLSAQTGVYHANLAAALLNQNRHPEATTAARAAIQLGFKGPHFVFDSLGIKP